MEIAGEKYQIHFDPALPEGIAFKDLAGNVVDVNSSIGRKLELKVFEKISDKYQVFARECKDIKTPLGQIIPDAMKPKVLQAIADKLHKPITVVQQMSFGPFIESMQKFSDAPSMKRFIAMLGGGSKLNAAMGIGTILLLNDDDKSTEELGMEYVKYTFG